MRKTSYLGEVICAQCDTVFTRRQLYIDRSIKRGAQMYCSRKCFADARRINKTGKNSPTINIHCSKAKLMRVIRVHKSGGSRQAIKTMLNLTNKGYDRFIVMLAAERVYYIVDGHKRCLTLSKSKTYHELFRNLSHYLNNEDSYGHSELCKLPNYVLISQEGETVGEMKKRLDSENL